MPMDHKTSPCLGPTHTLADLIVRKFVVELVKGQWFPFGLTVFTQNCPLWYTCVWKDFDLNAKQLSFLSIYKYIEFKVYL